MHKKYFPINWTDGVKLNFKHFRDSNYNVIQTIKNYNAISQKEYDFGILDRIDDIDAIKIELVNNSTENLTLKLVSCNAIAQNGYLIIYNEKLYGKEYPTKIINSSDYDNNINQAFYVVVTINPFVPIPVGMPDPEIIPLHHPYALPKISIDILPVGKTNTSYITERFLVVGKISLTNGKFIIDDEYIPPVKKIDYNSRLKNFKEVLVQVLVRVKNYSLQIFKKNKENLKSNKLVEKTFILCENINDFYSQNIFYLQSIIGEQSPIYFVDKISMLANKLSISLNTMDEKDRELLLQYYYEWTDIKPSDFLNIIGQVLSIQYNHIEINDTIKKLNNFLGIIDRLLKKMSDLEYIGQRKDNIVISEESHSLKKEKEKIWSILD